MAAALAHQSLLAMFVFVGCTPQHARDTPATRVFSPTPIQSEAETPTSVRGRIDYDDASPKCALLCRDFGTCWYETRIETCVAVSKRRCRESQMCKWQGRCDTGGPFGECIATSNEDCRASDNCARNGDCWAVPDGVCAKAGDATSK